MTPQDIAQVVADAVEREGLDADEVLVAVAAELVERRRMCGPVSSLVALVAMKPTPFEADGLVRALSYARNPMAIGYHFDVATGPALDALAGLVGVTRRLDTDEELRERALAKLQSAAEVRWGADVVRDADGRVIGTLATDPWNGMGPGRPPVCVSCGGPRDRADSDQCGECRG